MSKKDESEADGEKGASVMSLVRNAIAALGMRAKPAKMQEHILNASGRTVPTNQISTYKSMIKKRAKKGPPGKRGRPRLDQSTPAATPVSKASAGTDVLLDFVRTVREYENKLGTQKVLATIASLYEKS